MNNNLILVVEDDLSLQLIYERVLSRAGYEVLLARNGEEALEILQETVPSIIFLDMLLPHVNGATVLGHLVEDHRFDNTYIAIASSNPEFADYTQILNQGEFILKPILPSMIENVANKYLVATA